MPRWKALPEELDPQVKEFASQLRRLVDRSGLSIAAVADSTGYSKTSWERYLNGRLLAPKGAIVALAEVTGTNALHLTTMWELAERAWSRAEMRHDMTMEAIRISQARAALGEFGPAPAGTANSGAGGRTSAPEDPGGRDPERQDQSYLPTRSEPGHQGPTATPPSPGQGASGQSGPGQSGPARSGPGRGRAGRGGSGRGGGKHKVTMFLVGLVGALLVIAAAVLLTDLGGDGGDAKAASQTPSATPTTSSPQLPAGVKCSGKDCTGQDPETMGCGGQFAKTVSSATVGKTLVEVRYSKTCQAAWARITRAAPGDTVQISVGGDGAQNGLVNADNDAYTPMTAVTGPADAKACATLKTGVKGCTTPQ
ncbi:XRE family transcriptional regulator [Streptomyces sp. NBC_00210]|uniref:XRE family transcriptional regulator n=1 Tax=Streptomyces sp. NBC_00210 TaxID=2903636 RepID=UPI0032510868